MIDPGAAIEKMIAIGNENGISFTVDEVKSYLEKLDAENEFDDIEPDQAMLTAVAEGFVQKTDYSAARTAVAGFVEHQLKGNANDLIDKTNAKAQKLDITRFNGKWSGYDYKNQPQLS